MTDLRSELLTHVASLRRYALVLTRDRADAEDLVQETLTRGIAAVASWQPGTDLRAWLFRIMHNAWLDAVRRCGTRERWEAEIPDPVVAATQHLRLEVQQAMKAFGELPEPQRQAITMVAFEDMRYADAARAMDVPLGTFMSRLARGREALRRLLDGEKVPRLRVVGDDR